LLHNQFDVLALQARFIDLLAIIFILLLFVVMVMIVIMVVVMVNGLSFSVVVAGVRISLGLDNLLGSGCLSLGVEILNLGLAEDATLSQYVSVNKQDF
jgi:hypothetical protein